MSRWQLANVLQTTTGLAHLWQFHADGDKFVNAREQSCLPSEKLASNLVQRDWQSIFRPRFNLAWLPPDKAFLRVIHLPASEPSEIMPMIEFQLEKLSPLPVNQIVWSVVMLPRPEGKPEAMQTVIVAIAARSFVDEHLHAIETKGFTADCLELASIDQLINTKVKDDGVWVYVGSGDEPALVAWWYGGLLRNLALIPLSTGDEREKLFLSQLEQMAWAGELDGWLKTTPKVFLVAEPSEIAIWEPLLRKWVGDAFEIVAPIPAKELAALSAQRATQPASHSNLLPAEFSLRYHQQFIDSLWMRGLVALLAIYGLGVVVYMTALFFFKQESEKLHTDVAALTTPYTNALLNAARIHVIKDRQDLRYAALDCWKAVAQTLPESVTLDTFSFQRGKLDLKGTVPADRVFDITLFQQALQGSTIPREGGGEQLLFTSVEAPNIANNTWGFSCIMKGGDELK